MAWDRHEFTPAGGTRMHAAVTGPDHAAAVVCVPGLGSSFRYFLPLAEALAPEFRTVAVDLPGFGWSRGPAAALDVREAAAALADWLRATGHEGACLVGDSTGCQAIVDLAVWAPELLGPMVLAGPTFDRRTRSRPASQVGRLLLDGLLSRTGPGIVPVRVRDRLDSGFRRRARTFRAFLPDPVERKIDQIGTPVAVVRGGSDPLVPARWAEELLARLPDGRLVTVPGAGHTVNYTNPEVVAQAIREVIATAGVARRLPPAWPPPAPPETWAPRVRPVSRPAPAGS